MAAQSGASAFQQIQKRSLSRERPKTADGRKTSSQTRTARSVPDLPVPGQTIDFKAGDDVFSFPTPTPSPRLPPPKSATFAATPSPLSERESPHIGVALGSPLQAAMPSWGRSFTADHISKRMPRQPPPARVEEAIPQQSPSDVPTPQLRRKKSAWKSFGSLFGRRSARPPAEEPFYKLRLPEENGSAGSGPVTPSPRASPVPGQASASVSVHHRRTPSMTRGMARFEARAEADYASFTHRGQARKMRSPSMIQREGFSPMFRALEDTTLQDVKEGRNDSPLSMDENAESAPSPRTPRLDLEIPNPEFERYSVMFEKLLEEPKPSLLERRQSKLKRNKSLRTQDAISTLSVKEEANGVPQRSATSPGLMKSLSIRIGKKVRSPAATPEEVATAIHRPRPVERSKTAPPQANPKVSQSWTKPEIVVDGGLQPYADSSLPPTPMTFATISDNGTVAIIETVQHRPIAPEPSWQMMTSYAPRTPVEEGRSSPYRRVKSAEDLERQIVQVSVARQVSVSKAQRQVQQAQESKQPLRPRVVELSKNRKSTVVLIESGDE